MARPNAPPRPSLVRRLLLPLLLLVPLAADPVLADVQGAKALALALVGGLLLFTLEAELLLGRREPLAATGPELLLAALLGWSLLTLAWATNPALASARVMVLAGMLGAARTWREAVRDTDGARRWIAGLVVAGGAAVAVDGWLVRGQAATLDAAAVKYASVLFVHDNMAASFVTLLAPLLVALACGARSRGGAVGALLLLALLAAYLVELGSRAGLIGAALGALLVLALFALRRPLQHARVMPGRRGLAVVALAVVAAGLAPLSGAVRGAAKDAFYRGVSLLGFELQDVSFRPILWRKTMDLVGGHAWRGVGAGNFAVEFPRVERLQLPKPHAHNDALQVLVELGLPGLFLFLALLAAVAWLLVRALGRTRERRDFAVPAGLLAMLVVFAVVGVFEVPFALGATGTAFALLAGLAGSLGGPSLASPLAPRDRPTGRVPGSARVLARGLALVTLVALGPGLWTVVLRLPASTLQRRADEAFAAGRLDEAEALYRHVAGLHTGAFHPERRLGEIALARGDGEAALAHMRAARRLWPWSSERMVDEGDALFQLGRFGEAVTCYEAAVAATPRADEPFFRLLFALERDGRGERAVEMFEQRVREDDTISLDSILRLAEFCRRLGQRSEGDAQVEAWVHARHWYAVVAQDDPARRPALDEPFRDLTHHLQLLPGSPDSWWKVHYDRWRARGGWGLPETALRIGLNPDDRMLYPGWALPAEPVEPGAWRHP